jgi:group I intron endonuclease
MSEPPPERIHYIYLLTNTVNGKRYVGQTVNVNKRMTKHKIFKSDMALSLAIRKYGWNSFSCEVLACCFGQENSNYLETSYIAELNTLASNGFGYNLRTGGNVSAHSASSLGKMSAANKGKKLSDETKRRISEGLRGRNVSQDTRRLIAESKIGKKRSEEYKQNVRMLSDEAVKLILADQRPVKEIAADYKCSVDTVYRVKNNKYISRPTHI